MKKKKVLMFLLMLAVAAGSTSIVTNAEDGMEEKEAINEVPSVSEENALFEDQTAESEESEKEITEKEAKENQQNEIINEELPEQAADISDYEISDSQENLQENNSLDEDNSVNREETPELQEEIFTNPDETEKQENENMSEDFVQNDELDGFVNDTEADADMVTEQPEDSLPVEVPEDASKRKLFSGYVEKSDIFINESIESMLKVYVFDGNVEQQLNNNEYTILGYITEEEYLNTDHALDNLNSFKSVPDSAGVWFLVFEGVTPYFGRQAVSITVHDEYDLSMYNWSMEGDCIAGENPENALEVFKENSESYLLENEDYRILGYITDSDYENAQYNLDNISEVETVPNEPGQWIMIIEGTGNYHGRLIGWINVKDSFDLSMYQCNVEKESITVGENIEDYVQVSRNKFGDLKVLPADDYKVLGVVEEKEFAAGGYDINNIADIKEDANTAGGWYLIIEGNAPYFGRTAVWFNVYEKEEAGLLGMQADTLVSEIS